MVITREVVVEKLLAYLNNAIPLEALVDWAEQTFIDATLTPDEDIDRLNDILSYLAAADSPHFPLTWEKCTTFLKQLGVVVEVSVKQS